MTPEELYNALKDLKEEKSIKAIMEPFDKWIRGKHSTLESLNTNMGEYRRLVRTIPLVEGNFYIYKNYKGEEIKKHLFFKYAPLTSEEYQLLNTKANSKKEKRLDNNTLLEPQSYLASLGKLLVSEDYRELLVGIVGATGRRPCEVILRGEFKILKESDLMFPEQPVTHWVNFSGQSKKRRNTASEYFPIATLYPAEFIVKSVKRLRKTPEVVEQIKAVREEMKPFIIKLKEQITSSEDLDYQIALVENDLIDDKFETVSNRVVRGQLSKVLGVRHEKLNITRSSLRAAYACLATARDCPQSKNDLLWASRLLGHKEESGDLGALLTTAGYYDYYLEKEAVVELLDEPKAEPTAVFRGFVSDVNELKAFQEQWDITNQAETFRKIWELAKEAMKAREQKLFEKVEEINIEEEATKMSSKEELLAEVGQIIDERLSQLEDRFSKELAALQSVPLVTPAPIPTPTPTLDSNQDVVKPIDPQESPVEKDWSAIATEKLKGQKIPGSAEEKIRRAVKAIIDFNDYTAPSNNERWFIGIRSIQDLSGCNYVPIKKFLDDYKKMVGDHNSKYDLGSQHNKRHTKKIGEIIMNW